MQYWLSRRLLVVSLCVLGMLSATSCGGGDGGPEAGQGLVLLGFSLDGVDNAVLNEVLIFRFSATIAEPSITDATLQIREGPAFGLTVKGKFVFDDSEVRFEPRLPTLCDLSDGAFKPDTQYRVQLIGAPEQFAIKNIAGQSLDRTQTYEFHTRLDTDPDKYRDQIRASARRC